MPDPMEYLLDCRLLSRLRHFWAKTQCLSCKQASPHEAWYHYPSDEDRALQKDKALETTS